MKKVCNRIRKVSLIVCITYLILFNLSCGLDTFFSWDKYNYLSAYPQHIPEYDTDYAQSFFQFEVSDLDASEISYLGVSIYYKISNDYSKLITERSILESMASDAETKIKSPGKLMDPVASGGYGYQLLHCTNTNNDPIIPNYAKSDTIRIRLSDYQNIDDFSSRIVYVYNAGTKDEYEGPLSDDNTKTKPVRCINNLTFNFGRKGNDDKKPTDDNEDVVYSESKGNVWYVALYAVGVGVDGAFTPQYSPIVYLGMVAIDDTTEDN